MAGHSRSKDGVGIGALKRDELPEVKDKVAIELMRAIKALLDPSGIMNPGNVL
jgi:D-lactate dehydrogenase (cytochrome)